MNRRPELAAGLLLCAAVGMPGLPAAERAGAIFFSSNRSGSWRIWVMEDDGSGLKQLTEAEEQADDVDPAVSPDGKSLLFTSTRGGKTGIWKAGLDGAKPERVCDGDQAEWAPDGARIAFRRDEKIWVRHLSSGKEKRITPPDWPHCSGPSWSPDGETIAFACRWEKGNAIYTVPAGGGDPTKIYDKQAACEPHWSPDGKRIVYETESHLALVNPDGSRNRLITYYGGVQRYPRWSPDGKQIVFCQGASERGPWEIYAVSSAGGAPRRLTEKGSDMYPYWK